VHGSVLNDGFGVALWRLDRDRERGSATLVVSHVVQLTKRATEAIAADGRRLLRMLASDAAAHDVHFVAAF
jgi:hypothetical protein